LAKRNEILSLRSGRFLLTVLSQLRACLYLCLFILALVVLSVIEKNPAAAKPSSSLLPAAQGPDLDYSTFKHTSSRHAAQACSSCHQRSGDNSITPRFPGHSACQSCHLGQFVTAMVPMCEICHTDATSGKPPLKSFPTTFKESFNVKFDHAQHMTGEARPPNGCVACHRSLNRGVALTIPVSLNAHSQCYSCHTPSSKAPSGKEIASCGVCHDQKAFARTSTAARAFRVGFAHSKHAARQRLDCVSCHTLNAGSPQGRQVTSPRATEHFVTGGGQSCLTCHNGKRSFGGDLAFKDCRRCHTGSTFRMGT
jgi:c(7)-type cytochrome triheme protein